MADRFTRQTYKNLLSTGSVNLQPNVLIQQAPSGHFGKADENVHLMKNLKSAAVTTNLSLTSVVTMNNCGGLINSNTFSSNVFMAPATTTNTNSRNALGDIGNRITVPQPQNTGLLKKQETLKVVQLEPNEMVHDEEMSVKADQQKALNESSIMDVSEDIITDIDEFDSDNPQLVSEYAKDIYSYLNQLEKQFRISPEFLQFKIVTANMRAVLVDWLIQVHMKFHLLQETLYLCVQIIDAYLQIHNVAKMQLQLVGVTAMFLASKYEEMYVPAIEDFVYMTDNTYTKAEIRQMEIDILKSLDFLLCKPLPLHFLRRFSKAALADPKQHTLAKFFMELSLHDAEFASFDPSYLAACSLNLTFKILKGSEWNRKMEYYSTYKQSDLLPGMSRVARLYFRSVKSNYKYRAVNNKYGQSKFMRISLLPELNGDVIKEIASLTKSSPE